MSSGTNSAAIGGMTTYAAIDALVTTLDAEVKRRTGIATLRRTNFRGFVEGMRGINEHARRSMGEVRAAAQGALDEVTREQRGQEILGDTSRLGDVLFVLADAEMHLMGDDLKGFIGLLRGWLDTQPA